MSFLNPDVAGGVSEGIMHVPMGMSYALLAEMPPQYGLYNSLIYPFIYLFLGTGRQASMGVSALEALLCSEAVNSVIGNDASLQIRIQTTIALSLCLGCVLFVMRFLGLAIIANILADPVLSGFSTASAFLIGATQLKHLFGMTVPRWGLPKTVWHIMSHLDNANWICFGIGAASVAVLTLVKFLNQRFFRKFPLPGQVFVVVISTLVVYLTAPSGGPTKVPTVGDIPRGLPKPTVPSFPPGSFARLLYEAVALAAMYFIIHISITKSISRKRNYRIDSGQELTALGTCNIIGSFFQCFPNATSLSRSSVVNSIGSKTVLHNVPAVIVVILTLTVMTPLLSYLPFAALASIVLVGVAGMADFGEAVRLFGLMSPDFLLWLAAFLGTVLLGAMKGIIVSVALSLLWLLWKSSRPSTAVLGCLPGTVIYRNTKRFPMAYQPGGVKIFRFDASLNFSNSDFFENKINALKLKESGVSVLIIDGSSINDLDVTAIRMLQRVVSKFDELGILLIFANWKGPMRDFLDRARFYDSVLPERCFLSLHDAVVWSEAYVNSLQQQLQSPQSSALPQSARHQLPSPPLGMNPTDLSGTAEDEIGRPISRHFWPAFRRTAPSRIFRHSSRLVSPCELPQYGTSSPVLLLRHGSPLMSGHRRDSPTDLIYRSNSLTSDMAESCSRQMITTPLRDRRDMREHRQSTMERARALLRAVTQPHPPSPPIGGGSQERERIGKALGMVNTAPHALGLTSATAGVRREMSYSNLSAQGQYVGALIPTTSPITASAAGSVIGGGRRPLTANPLGPFDHPRVSPNNNQPSAVDSSNGAVSSTISGAAICKPDEDDMEGIADGSTHVFEWDGLSACIPSVRLVEEVTEGGQQRTWGVAATLDTISGIWYSNSRAYAAWNNERQHQTTDSRNPLP